MKTYGKCWLVLVALLTGCDPGGGMRRQARVAFMPATTSVISSIRETPGVDDVQYRSFEGGRPLTLTGPKPPDQIYSFSYRGGSNVFGELQFVVNYKGQITYSQTLSRLGGVPKEWIEATHPVMIQIETRLEQNCGLTNFSKSVEESFYGGNRK